ncbi:uncharacterized protein F5891DRAFT_979730 [Suillus fuscotomentosus]|uniref:DUF6532 domain-containing protein n=1 Tax=Suillus fuscotomentosus TaxID=1912939 RepID=A0AAD4E7T9_9AGAM|nr:uncharacterized protein F5891DRAFT_979730 [Suillus fuscotomentosus]KAG1901192.1 hypothetical protein F5891DRAFT_979730 [Suillus fuscotomentosus]
MHSGSHDEQPPDTFIDTSDDNVGQSSHSTYPLAASSQADLARYQQSLFNDTQAVSFSHHDSDFYYRGDAVNAQASHQIFLADSQSSNSFPNLNVVNPSASLLHDPFHFALDNSQAGYHPIYNSSATPYADSGPPHLHPPRYLSAFPPPIVSVDGISTLTPEAEDIQPLQIGEPPLHLDEPLPLGDSFTVSEPSPPVPGPSGSRSRQPPVKGLDVRIWPYPHARSKLRGLTSTMGSSGVAPPMVLPRTSAIAPLQYSDKIRVHRRIFEEARVTLIRSALVDCPFLTEQERKEAALRALASTAEVHDKKHGDGWAKENLAAFYKTFTVTPSADITSTFKKAARAVVQFGYKLRPSIWSEESEPQYQIDMVKDLIDDPSFPLKYIFGNSSDLQRDQSFAFEHPVIETVLLNAILKLGYVPFVTELDSLYCTATVAVECVLMELAGGRFAVTIDFGVTNFKAKHTLLQKYIRDFILPNPELSTRWQQYKLRTCDRLIDIHNANHNTR